MSKVDDRIYIEKCSYCNWKKPIIPKEVHIFKGHNRGEEYTLPEEVTRTVDVCDLCRDKQAEIRINYYKMASDFFIKLGVLHKNQAKDRKAIDYCIEIHKAGRF